MICEFGKKVPCGIWMFFLAAALLVGAPVAHAKEASTTVDSNFVRAKLQLLRQQRRYESAIEYLDYLKQQKRLPEDYQHRFDYEQAISLMGQAKISDELSLATATLSTAADQLELFIKDQPGSSLVVNAHAVLVQSLDSMADKVMQQWDDQKLEITPAQRVELHGQAIELYARAEKVCEAALAELKKRLLAMRDGDVDLNLRESYRKGYLKYQSASAMIPMKLAKLYPDSEKERGEHLQRAMARFERLRKKYPTLLIGQCATFYAGRCQQQLGHLTEALKLYRTAIDLPAEAPLVRPYITLAYYYALKLPEATLGGADRKAMIQQAKAWIDQARPAEQRKANWILLQRAITPAKEETKE